MLIVILAAALAADDPTPEQAWPVVASSYRALHRWTSERDPTPQPEAVVAYSRDLRALVLGYRSAEDPLLLAETDRPSLRALRASLRASVLALSGTLDTPAERALVAHHARVVAYWSDGWRKRLDAVQNPPADWIVSPGDAGRWWIEDVRTQYLHPSTNPIPDIWGADRWSTSARNRQPRKRPGDVILLAPGDYPASRLTLTYDLPPGVAHGLRNSTKIPKGVPEFGLDPVTIIRSEVPGAARIQAQGGSSKSLYIEWTGAVDFEWLTFLGGAMAAFATENPKLSQGEWQGFRDIRLLMCSVLGGWDPTKPGGAFSTWGVFTYEVGRSAGTGPGFVIRGGEIRGFEEHAIYAHGVRGNSPEHEAVLIEDVKIRDCGRTAYQMASRTSEVPMSVGGITLRRLDIADVCIIDGGSAITLKGRLDGTVLIQECVVRLGANEDLDPSRRDNITGALVVHLAGGAGGIPTREVIVDRCVFVIGPRTGKGSFRRPCVMVSGVGRFALLDSRVEVAPGGREALDFDPSSIGELALDRACEIRGDVRWGEKVFRDTDADGDGREDGAAWAAFLTELETAADADGDGTAISAGAVSVSVY